MRKIVATLVLVVSMTFASASRAQIPVTDALNWVENMLSRIDGYLNLLEQYKQLEQLVNTARQVKKTYDNMNGGRWIQDFKNQFADTIKRRYAPGDVENLWALRDQCGGVYVARLCQEIDDILAAYYDLVEPDDLFTSEIRGIVPGHVFESYNDLLVGSQTSMALGRATAYYTDERITAVEDILRGLAVPGGEENDLKHSLDAVARLVAEHAILSAETNRLLGILLSDQAAERHSQIGPRATLFRYGVGTEPVYVDDIEGIQ